MPFAAARATLSVMNTTQTLTQVSWALAVGFAMIAAGMRKRRLEWKRRPRNRRKRR